MQLDLLKVLSRSTLSLTPKVGGWSQKCFVFDRVYFTRIGSYGGINPYTLMARLGLGDLAHYETARGLIQLPGVSHKETRRGDQEGF